MKDKIFDNIFYKFAKGEKLKIYNEKRMFRDIQNRDHPPVPMKKEPSIKKIQVKKRNNFETFSRKMSIQQADDTLTSKKKLGLSDANFMKFKSKDEERRQRREQMNTIKKAVKRKEISLSQANDILLQNVKQEN